MKVLNVFALVSRCINRTVTMNVSLLKLSPNVEPDSTLTCILTVLPNVILRDYASKSAKPIENWTISSFYSVMKSQFI